MTERVEKLLQAGNEASARVRNLWITFLLFGTYLAIAIGGTTHRQMLLESPLVLPILNTGLPLVDFYRIAPGLFLVFHFYMLVQLYLLAQKLREFNSALVYPAVPHAAQDDLRTRADNFLITQMLAGRRHALLVRIFVWLAAWLTMVAAPLALFLAFQIRFLPYHDVVTTWIHRAFLILDVLLLWLVWPAVSSENGRLGGAARALFWERPIALFQSFRHYHNRATEAYEARRYWRFLRNSIAGHLVLQREWFALLGSLIIAAMIGIGSIGVVGFSLLVATIPAEEIERWLLDHPLQLTNDEGEPLLDEDGKERFEKWSFGPPSFATLKPAKATPPLTLFDRAVWSSKRPRERQVPVQSEPNTVWWPTAILFEGEPDQASSKVTSLFSRNLVLVDDLDLVTLNDDELEKVDRTLVLRGRDLRYARFDRADMRKADMFGANLAGASLSVARLSSANFEKAKLQGSYLHSISLEAARFYEGNLDGANLSSASLSGASFVSATLQGAYLGSAILHGANLNGANLQGAILVDSQLQGADLSGAKLQGAFLGRAQMQGANLGDADLSGASLVAAALGLVQARNAKLTLVDVRHADLSGPFEVNVPAGRNNVAVSVVESWLKPIPEGSALEWARERMARLIEPSRTLNKINRNAWDPWEHSIDRPPQSWTDDLESELASMLAKFGCASRLSTNIAKGLILRIDSELTFLRTGVRYYHSLLATKLRSVSCNGSINFTDQEEWYLDQIALGNSP